MHNAMYPADSAGSTGQFMLEIGNYPALKGHKQLSPELSRAEGVGLNELLELMRLNPRGTHAN